MLKGAKRAHKTVMEIAKEYTDAFFKDVTAVHNRMPDVVEPATNCIPEFINMVEVLIEKGYAYEAGGNIYFDTSKLKEYYVFGDFSEDDLAVAVREGVDEPDQQSRRGGSVIGPRAVRSRLGVVMRNHDNPTGGFVTGLKLRVKIGNLPFPHRSHRPERVAADIPSRRARGIKDAERGTPRGIRPGIARCALLDEFTGLRKGKVRILRPELKRSSENQGKHFSPPRPRSSG